MLRKSNRLIDGIALMMVPLSFSWAQSVEKDSRDMLVEARTYHILVRNIEEANSIFESLASSKEEQRLANFRKAAKKSTIDPGSVTSGGDLGYIMEGTMIRPFEETMLSVPIGSISKPFKTQFGWHLVLVTDRRNIPVAKVCDDSIKQAIKNAPKNDQDKLQISYQKKDLEELIPTIKNYLGSSAVGPFKNELSEFKFILAQSNAGQTNEKMMLVHTEHQYPKLAPSFAGLACYRSTREFVAINCRDRTFAFAGFQALEGRGGYGKKLIETPVPKDKLSYKAIIPMSLGAQLYEAACSVSSPKT